MAIATHKADGKQSHDVHRDIRLREARIYGERLDAGSTSQRAYHTLTPERRGERALQKTHENGGSANRQEEGMYGYRNLGQEVRKYGYRDLGHEEKKGRHRDRVKDSGEEEYVKCCVMS